MYGKAPNHMFFEELCYTIYKQNIPLVFGEWLSMHCVIALPLMTKPQRRVVLFQGFKELVSVFLVATKLFKFRKLWRPESDSRKGISLYPCLLHNTGLGLLWITYRGVCKESWKSVEKTHPVNHVSAHCQEQPDLLMCLPISKWVFYLKQLGINTTCSTHGRIYVDSNRSCSSRSHSRHESFSSWEHFA